MAGHDWPDGGSYLSQPNILTDAWPFIGRALHLAKEGKPQEL